jgi:hypothetical protein
MGAAPAGIVEQFVLRELTEDEAGAIYTQMVSD